MTNLSWLRAILVALVLAPWGSIRGDSLSLAQAVRDVQEMNPDIHALQEQAESAHQRALQALSPSDPSVSLSSNDLNYLFDWGKQGPGDWSNAGSIVASVNQPFSFPGKAILSFSAGQDQADALSAQVKSMELQVSGNVKNAYYQLAVSLKNLDLNSEQEEIYDQIVAVVKRRYEAGSVTQVDLANAQMAVAMNDSARADLVLAERNARAQLNILLGRPQAAPLEIDPLPEHVSFLDIDRNEALEKLEQRNLQLLSARSQERAASKNYALAWMSLLPDYQISVASNTYNEPSFADASASPVSPIDRSYSVSLAFNFPVWFLFNETRGIAASAHDRAAAQDSLRSEEMQNKTALESALATLDNLKSKLGIYQDQLLPLSELALKMALINYGTAKIGFQDLAAAATALWSTRSTYNSLLASYASAYTNFGQLIGEDL